MAQPILATYRIQLNGDFGFAATARIVPYLAALGVSHLYLSPLLQAVPGSTHGYDVTDPTRVSEELGGPAGFERLRRIATEYDIGIVLDIVPNHLAIGTPDNRWWWDVLRNGQSSRYASYFDVDWNAPESRLRDLVLVPILADHYGRELERGAIQLQWIREGDELLVQYADHVLPVSPRSMDTLLQAAAVRCGSNELAAIADAYAALPLSTATDRKSVLRRHRNHQWLRSQLHRLAAEAPAVAQAIDAVVADHNHDVEMLHGLLERQNYRLAFWRAADRDLGYRRFFDINSLAGLRVEEGGVFDETHGLVLEWVASGQIDGLRIDHVDGLRDPEAYLERLRAHGPAVWVVVEKILSGDETLPERWPVAGTTGYDALNQIGGLFIDGNAESWFTALYQDLTGEQSEWADVCHAKKHQVLRQALASDVNRLTALLVDICERHRRHRDYSRHDLQEALREILANFRVYRTYVQSRDGLDEPDVAVITEAVAGARRRRPDIDASLLQFVCDLLSQKVAGDLEAEFLARVQQLTGPVMAKGVEDTAFYCFNRFVALNEVGGDPQRFGFRPAAFHAACIHAQREWPLRMVTTSTHDTKRSEDVRSRLAVLSEIPQRWAAAVRDWMGANDRWRRNGIPDPNAEYLLYQTLVGAWPLEAERAVAYMLKAAREAKTHTSWTRPDETYEAGLHAFVEAILADEKFTAVLEDFVRPLIDPGRVNALAQTLIKMTAPGIPDLYQGSELWDLSLVDPDNRRPVDFARRAEALALVATLRPEEIWAARDQGLPKLWVIHQALALRRERPECFGAGATYGPLSAVGRYRDNLIAFERSHCIVTVVPRLASFVRNEWDDTTIRLPGVDTNRWLNVLDGEEHEADAITADALFERFPVALLTVRAPSNVARQPDEAEPTRYPRASESR